MADEVSMGLSGTLEPVNGRDWWEDPDQWEDLGDVGLEAPHSLFRTRLLVRSGRNRNRQGSIRMGETHYGLVRYDVPAKILMEAMSEADLALVSQRWKKYLAARSLTVVPMTTATFSMNLVVGGNPR